MKFIKNNQSSKKIEDNVFEIVRKCKLDENKNKINATIGMLYNDQSQLVTLKTVYDEFNKIKDSDKARYAQGILGNQAFLDEIKKWYIKDIKIPNLIVATPSGTAAVSSCLSNYAQRGDAVIIPSVTWDPYYVILNEHELKPLNYEMFKNDKLNIEGIKQCVDSIKNKQKNIVLIINDPCHNPTGYSMELNEWKELINYCNSLVSNNIIILNDVAYIDYAFNEKAKEYIKLFNEIKDHVVVCIAVSFSKSMTAYGMRLGALINIFKNAEDYDEIHNAFLRTARGIWSNANNGAMECFYKVLTNPHAYLNEKQNYINLIKQRAKIFCDTAKKNNLPIYPYKEGFFVTIKIHQDILDNFHALLMQNHLYTIKINGGIRVGICSIPTNQIERLVIEIANIYNKIKS